MRPVPLRYGFAAMLRRPVPALLSAVCLIAAGCASVAGAASAVSTTKSLSEAANPINDQGFSYQYRSNITAITPRVPGLSIEVLEFADRLLLRNHTGKTVTIYGYEGEPYARVLANGTAEQNVRAPATYLNTNFYAQVVVPPVASAGAPPKWEVVDRTAEFEWHDHRIHWMSPVPPARVKNLSKRTLIFNWQVPIMVGCRQGRDRRTAVLDSRELQGAAGGDYPGRRDRTRRAGIRRVRTPPARARDARGRRGLAGAGRRRLARGAVVRP